MEFIGKVKGFKYNASTGLHEIVLSTRLNMAQLERLDALQDRDLRITAAVKRKDRSLTANAYAWVLMSEIASLIGTSKEEVYGQMLLRYAPFARDEHGYVCAAFPESRLDFSPVDLDMHWKYLTSQNGMRHYILLKGMSQYDVAEMAVFLDHIVEEAKELGIDTEGKLSYGKQRL